MHELPYYPPDYSSSKGTPLFPFRPTREASFSQPAKERVCLRVGSLGRMASFAPMYRVSALFEPDLRAQTCRK